MKPWQIDWDTDVSEGGAMPWDMELEAEAGSERTERKRSAGEVATDVGKSLGGSVMSAIGAIPKAAGRALQMGGDEEQPLSMDEAMRRSGADGTSALDETKALLEFERTNRVGALDVIGRGVEWLGDKTMDAGQAIRDSRSDEAKRLAEQSTPSGDLTKPSTWSMGEDPSVEGLTHVGADVMGSMAPVVASAVATRGRSAATQVLTGGATVGAQVGGSAMTEARDYLAAMDDETLFEASPLFRELIEQKNTPEQARAILTRRAENTAAAYAAPVGMVGGQATGALLGKGGEKLAGMVPGITGKALVLGVLGATEEGLQEVAEGVATRVGINDAAGTDRSLTEGTFAEAVLGAKGGGVVGAGRGALAGLAQRQAPAELDQVESVRGDEGRETAAVQPSVPPQSPAVEPPAGNERQLFDTPAPAANRLQGPSSPDTQQAGVRLAELEIAAQSRDLEPWEEFERSELTDGLESEERPPESSPRSSGEPSTATQPSRASTDQVLPVPPASREVQSEGRAVAVQPVPSGAGVDSGALDAFQNRDRSRAASVAQMADIARDPDYLRLATSRTPDAGAPMVFAVGDSMLKVLAENSGKADVAVMSDGQRVPFRYAVVDASTVEPSNFVDGRPNPAYGANVIGSLKALNNGRTAGLRAAYQEGTAGRYQAELIADAEAHGVPVEAIRRTPNPILVRLYSEGSNTPDMAAKSQGQGLGMSPAELASQDARLIDTGALSVLQPGDPSSAANRDFVRTFVGRLRQTGQDVAGFMTAEGTLSPAGRQRMQAALMQAAYEDAELVGELFDSLDTDIKSIGEALKAVAGEWASMRDSARQGLINPEVDITDNLVQAVNLIRRARRDRTSLYDLTRQPDLMTGDVPDPITVGTLRMFYGGSYFVRPLGRDAMIGMLRDYTRSAMVTTADADMFGEQVAPGQILASFESEGVSNAQDPAQNGRRLPDSGASAVSGADEGRGAEERYDGGAGSPRVGRTGRGDGKESQDAASREGRNQGDETPKADAQAGQPRVAERQARETGNSGKSLGAASGKKPPRTADRDFWAYAKEQGHAPKDVQVGSELHTRLKAEFEALKAGKARFKAITGKKLEGDWVAFAKASGALGVPRADMPQIKAEHRGALTQFLAARGATHQAEVELDAASLRPTQAEFSTAKVQQAQDFDGGERSILISADSYVLDGHHQWLAALAQGLPIRAIRFDAPMAELLPLTRAFPSADAALGAAASRAERNPVAMESEREYSQPYETDLFGETLPASNRAAAKAARPARVRGNAQPAGGVPRDTPAPAGEYSVRTVVGSEVKRKLGASRINSYADLAQATQYLYKSAVERFDAIVTDNDGTPLAVVGGFKGAVNQVSVYAGTIIGEAVRVPGAGKIWLSHNHPSGTAKLSEADKSLNQSLVEAMAGSGVEPMGLIAVAGAEYAATDGTAGKVPPASGSTEVPVIERELIPAQSQGAAINSPNDAKRVAKSYYERADAPGIILLDSQNRVSAWIPIPENMRGYLRYEDSLNAIYRAVSESNAAAAILAHGGELDATPFAGKRITSSQNIMAALRKVDVRPLDTINVKTNEAQAETGMAIEAGTLLSRADEPVTGPLGILNAIAHTDELFQLPKSGADTIEAITADINPEITVKRSPGVPGRTEYTFTMPDGKTATMTIRPRNPYGETVYGFDLQDGEMMNLVTERPGENPEDVAPDVEDVWIDVSRLKSGGDGASVYAIAANFAHNTDRIFIGDPAGLSDQAMRRRPEQMLSSALKFGTTKHLAPHPRQVAGDSELGIPALKWVFGDDVGNIRRLIDLNLKTLENAGLHDAINFDPSTGDYTDSSGSPIGRDGIEAGVALGLGRGARAGGKTLARRAVLASLVRGEGQAKRGADGRSDGLLEELLRVARQFPAATEGVFYSRNLNGKAGTLPGRIGFAELKALADRLKAGAPNMPAVNVLADPSQAPRALREYINRQGAWFDVEGAMHDGELYLFASGLASAERAEHVLIEHEAAHYGLRAVLGTSLKTAMRLVYVQNASVRKAVTELQKRSNLSELVATEEVIVDIPTAELARLKGWRKVVMAARDWLASRGYTTLAQKLTDWLDGSLTQQQRADLFVADLVRAAREYATGKGSSRALVAMGTRLSGSLAEDIAKQEAWLQREAQARGFKDIEDLLARNYPAFEKLAELWRKNNPTDSLMSRRRDQTQTQEFKAWFGDSKVVDAEGKPLVVYHGTKRSFSSFKAGKEVGVAVGTDASAELGNFFSNDLQYVEGLLDSADGVSKFAEGANVMPVFLALRNPKIEPMQKIQDIEDGWSAERARRYRKHVESLGHDGIIFEGQKSREFVVFKPEQIKSAIGNLGTFDPARQDVLLSRGNGQGKIKQTEPNAWEKAKARVQDLTSPEAIDRLLYEFQDKFIDLRRMREHIKALGGTITDLNDAYLGEELYHKRLAKRTADFLDKELKPLLADMRARAIKLPDLESYLHARHAPEANRVLAERNPNRAMLEAYRREAAKVVRGLELQLQRAKAQGSATSAIEESLAIAHEEVSKWTGAQAFNGTEAERLALSGMSDSDAKAHMDGLSPAKRKHLEHLADVVDQMQAQTLVELESYGLMDRATLSAWRSTYEHYVPLHRDEAKAESDRHPIGQGFSVKGSASRDRVGSNEKVTNILAHIAMQREAALTRGEKNLVVKKLYLMAAQNPDEEFWKLDAPPKIKTVDPRNGTVRTTIDPTFKHRPNVLMLRIAGRDKAIVFNEHNPSAVRLAESMKNLDIGDLHVVLGLAAKGTRWFASVNTQYNPIFGVINFARDVQAAMLQLSTTPLAGQQKEVASHVFTAMRAIYRQRRGKRARKDAWTKLWDEFENVGGTTGYRDLFADTNDRVKALTRELKALDRGQVSKAAHAVVDWLSDYNEAMENAVRLAAYRVALDQGMTKERAASLAKNLTVNFNRKGRQTRELGALYAFFNAALQGTARMVETLKGPIGKRIMFGGIALGAINTLVGMAVMGGGDDDEADNWDKIPDFIKERSLIIPLGREDYVSIPMPLGFHVFPNIGRVAVEMAMSDGHKSAARQVGDLLMVLVDAFNPVGGGGNLGQMVAPTVIDPVVGLVQNLDWTGRQIYREDFSSLDPTPGHSRTKDSASTASRGLAEAINAITGGNEYRPGAWSPTPDQIDYVFGQLTGGLGRELIKANQTIASTFTGDELPPYKVPLLGRVYGNTRGPAGQSDRYYENVKLLNELENELRGRQMKREDISEFREAEPLTDLISLGSGTQRQIQKLRTLRRREAEEAKDGYREELQRIDEQIAEAMSRLNNEVSRVLREQEGAK